MSCRRTENPTACRWHWIEVGIHDQEKWAIQDSNYLHFLIEKLKFALKAQQNAQHFPTESLDTPWESFFSNHSKPNHQGVSHDRRDRLRNS
jgi:hypothetical protein